MKSIFIQLSIILVGFLIIASCQGNGASSNGKGNLNFDLGINEVSKDQAKGFYWDYLIYLPAVIKNHYILVVPNNTGFHDNDINVHKEYAYGEVNSRKNFADRLGIPLLVPVFPRPDDETDATIASQYLGRGTFETEIIELSRQDLQMLAMVDDALEKLKEDGYTFSTKILIWGYSASAIFSSRLTILHPDRIKAAAFGGHGWSIVPTSRVDDLDLPFPYGVFDLEELTGSEFDASSFADVAIYSFMGVIDDNGWGMHWYVGTEINSGQFYDSFDNKFGTTAPELMDSAENIYSFATSNATFHLYEGVGHEITDEMNSDVLAFFNNSIY